MIFIALVKFDVLAYRVHFGYFFELLSVNLRVDRTALALNCSNERHFNPLACLSAFPIVNQDLYVDLIASIIEKSIDWDEDARLNFSKPDRGI